jgi:hypothetical protein
MTYISYHINILKKNFKLVFNLIEFMIQVGGLAELSYKTRIDSINYYFNIC